MYRGKGWHPKSRVSQVSRSRTILFCLFQRSKTYFNITVPAVDTGLACEALLLISSLTLVLLVCMQQVHTEDSPTWADLADPLATAQSQLDRIIESIAQRKGQQ